MTDTTNNDEPTTPTREQIDQARIDVQALAQHVIDVMEDDDVTARVQADLANIERVIDAALFSQPSPSITAVPSCGFDTEAYAAAHNDGWDAAVAQELQDHPAAFAAALRAAADHIEQEQPSPSTPPPALPQTSSDVDANMHDPRAVSGHWPRCNTQTLQGVGCDCPRVAPPEGWPPALPEDGK